LKSDRPPINSSEPTAIVSASNGEAITTVKVVEKLIGTQELR